MITPDPKVVSPEAPPASTEPRAPIALPLLVAATMFMQILDGSVVTPAIPAMARAFEVPPVDLNLGVSTYVLTVGVLVPVSGWAAQKFGARPVFLSSIIIFTLASMLCGLCQTLPQFVAARILQGVGGAMMLPVGRLIVLARTPKSQLVRAMALLIWPALIAPVLGPPVGGLITDQASWHWIFWLNLPLGVLAFLAGLKILPHLDRDWSKRFDWFGFLTLGPAMFCLLFAAETLGGEEARYLQVAVLGGLALGLTLLGLWHLRRSDHPLLRFEAMSERTFSVTVVGGSMFRMAINMIPFLIPLLFQIGFGWSAFDAGMMLMAVFLGNIVMKPFTTPIMRRWGFRRVLVVNAVVNALAIGSMIFIAPDMNFWVTATLLFVAGMARSLQFTALGTMAFADLGPDRMPDANTLNATFQQLSRALGIALGAIGWRLGEALFAGGDPAAPFKLGFAIAAVFCLFSLFDVVRLAPGAGDNVSRAGRKPGGRSRTA